MTKKIRWRLLPLIPLLLACALGSPAPPVPTLDPRLTHAAETKAAQPESTATQEEAAQPEFTAPTSTPQPPSATPPPTAIPSLTPTSTEAYAYCDWAEFIQRIQLDVPVKDGDFVHPGQEFTITWRVENIGGCVWTQAYSIALVSGEPGDAVERIQPFPEPALHGDTLDLSFAFIAPSTPGAYEYAFLLQNADGQPFGVGETASDPLTINFSVLSLSGGVGFDFIAARCQAQWYSGEASFLPCQGSTSEQNLGYVRYDTNPSLEHKTNNNPPVLNVHTNRADNGYIRGIYPAYTVRPGDIFLARVGCMEGMTGCDVAFSLRYINEEGEIINLGGVLEEYDEQIHVIKVDLGGLVGKKVRFILQMNTQGGRTLHANGFWMDPRIER